jgi:hypothetical protein
LIFSIARLPGWYGASSGLAMTPSRPAPSNSRSHGRSDGAVAGDRRQVERRPRSRQHRLEGGAALLLRRVDQARAAGREHVEGDEGGRRRQRELPDSRFGRVQALLQGVEVEAIGADDDDLAVDDRSVGQQLDEGVAQFGEIAIERAQVAALDRDLAGARAKDEGAKAVPLRLEQIRACRRQDLDRLGEHRLDRRELRQRRGGGLRHARRCRFRRWRWRRRYRCQCGCGCGRRVRFSSRRHGRRDSSVGPARRRPGNRHAIIARP